MELTKLKAHPAADIFPKLQGDELQDLADDIKAHGLQEPVWLYEDPQLGSVVLDGRNRIAACAIAGVTPATRLYTGDKPLQFVVSLNLVRRHLNESQRAMVASRVATLSHGGNRSKSSIDDLTQSQAAELLNVGKSSVERARVVQEKGTKELIDAVDAGEVSVSKAAKIAAEPEAIQKSVVKAIVEADADDLLSMSYHQKHRKGADNAERLIQSDWNEWHTPTQYIEAARTVLGDIDLDPASSEEANQTVKATDYYSHSGLQQPWHGRIWLNPPYGGEAEKFITHLIDEYNNSKIEAGIVLVNAHSTDTKWFQPLWDHTLCFTDHRIDFTASSRRTTTAITTSTHGSVFAYLGSDPDRFAAEFKQFGPVVRRIA